MQSFGSMNVNADTEIDGTTIKGAVNKAPGSVGTIVNEDWYNFLMVEMDNVLQQNEDSLKDSPTGDDGKQLVNALVKMIDDRANPIGTIIPHASKKGYNPVGLDKYLFCDGSVVIRTEYPLLFAAIEDSYNIGGELATEFRLPNLVDVYLRGAQTDLNMGPTVKGSNTTTLTVSNLPDHTHEYLYIDGAGEIFSPDWRQGATPEAAVNGIDTGGMVTGGTATAFDNNPLHLSVYYYIRAL